MSPLEQLKEFALNEPLKAGAVALGVLSAGYFLRSALRPVAALPSNAVVVVTGCDSGIGLATAKLLAGQSRDGQPEFKVLAGCLTSAGVASLTALGLANLIPFQVDVTSEDSVSAMARFAESHCPDGLFALYNIAGINAGSFTDLTTIEEFKRVMDVNLFGVIRCTQALMHLLHKSAYAIRLANAKDQNLLKPRIVTVSSVASEIPIPGAGPYTASKHAVKGFCNALRPELAAFGIEVIEIRPFFVDTAIVPSGSEKEIEMAKANLVDKFGEPAPNGHEVDPAGFENPIHRYRGGLDKITSGGAKLSRALPRSSMMTPELIAGEMLRLTRAYEPPTNVVCANSWKASLAYEIVKHAPEMAMSAMARAAGKSMRSFAPKVVVEKPVEVKVVAEKERELVAA